MILESCPSTNDWIREKGESGAPHGTWVCARTQSAGRGRQGRQWISEPGNLHFSSLARIRDPRFWTWVPLAAAVALVEALREIPAGDGVAVKWPNDLWWKGKKVAGFLCELHTKPEPFIVIGLGLNCLNAPADAASLSDIAGRPVHLEEVLSVWTPSLSKELSSLEQDGSAEISRKWSTSSLFKPGDPIEWSGSDSGQEKGPQKGWMLGLGSNGDLRVRTEKAGEISLYAEEVRGVRAVPTASCGFPAG